MERSMSIHYAEKEACERNDSIMAELIEIVRNTFGDFYECISRQVSQIKLLCSETHGLSVQKTLNAQGTAQYSIFFYDYDYEWNRLVILFHRDTEELSFLFYRREPIASYTFKGKLKTEPSLQFTSLLREFSEKFAKKYRKILEKKDLDEFMELDKNEKMKTLYLMIRRITEELSSIQERYKETIISD